MTDWKNNICYIVQDKGPISRGHKELLQIIKRKSTNQRAKDVRHSEPPPVREMQIRAMMKHYFFLSPTGKTYND